MTIENEKMILSYLCNTDNMKMFKGVLIDLFDNENLNLLFKTIKQIETIDPLIIQDILFKKDIKVSVDELNIIIGEKEYSEDWVSTIFIPWKKQVLIRDIMKKVNTLILKNDINGAADLLNIELDLYSDKDDKEEELDINNTPTIDDNVFETLPQILIDIFKQFDNKRDRDVIFTSALPVLSILFPNVSTIWNGELDRANLYSFVTAPAASGKGKMGLSYELIHEYLELEKLENENKRLQIEHSNSLLSKGEEKEIFHPKISTIPGNSSAAAFFQKIYYNDGIGLSFVTEADDIVGNKRLDWGNYDGFYRLAFHNESISRNRMEEEIITIQNPYISFCISGTPDQLMNMFADKSENGLFSRVIFYAFGTDEKWKRRFDDNYNVSYKEEMKQYSKEIMKVHNFYKGKNVKVRIDKRMSDYMDDSFEYLKSKYISIYNDEITSSVHRIAVISRKILLILTMFRYYNDKISSPHEIKINSNFEDLFKDNGEESFNHLEKSFGKSTLFDMNIDEENKYIIKNDGTLLLDAKDIDVYNAVSLAKTYLKHTALMFNSFYFNNVNKKSTVIKDNKIEQLIFSLPETFQTNEAYNIGKVFDVSVSTIKRYLTKGIKNGLLVKINRGEYRKINKKPLPNDTI